MPTLEEIRSRFAKSTATARREAEQKTNEERKAAEAAEQARLVEEARELAERFRAEQEETKAEILERKRAELARMAEMEREEATRRTAEAARLAEERDRAAARGAKPHAVVLRSDEHACEVRHLEYRGGSSRKFWMAGVVGCRLVRRWGRIGTTGQGQWQEFSSEAMARSELEDLFRRKLAKGYAVADKSLTLVVRFYVDGTVGWRKLPD